MAQAHAAITAEVLATWMTPNEAAAYVARALQTDDAEEAGRAIWERLKAGIIRAACLRSARTPSGYAPTQTNTPTIIPASHWDYFTDEGSNFWNGDARFFFPDSQGLGHSDVVRCFGIKLDPESVATTLPSLPKPKPVTDTPTPHETPEPNRGQPVSEALLSGWYALYCQAYQGPADTLENALQSARGMFPGKFVSRDRVRALCAGRKRGRKERGHD